MNPVFFKTSAAVNSFFDLTTRLDSDKKNPLRKNTVGFNELTHSRHFTFLETNIIKKIFALNWPNHVGDGITLRQNRVTSHSKNASAQRVAPRQGRKNIRDRLEKYV